MGASWQLVTGPVLEPITLAEAKAHARLYQGDDSTLRRYMLAARETAEETLNRGLLTQTWQLVIDYWAPVIYLPRAAPLQSVTSVKYYDAAGTQQTLSSAIYTVDTVSRPVRITLAPNQTWPVLQSMRFSGRIEIVYVIGWATAAAVPERIKQGIRMYLAYLELDRDGLEVKSEQARQAAAACWDDRVPTLDPYGQAIPQDAYSVAASLRFHQWDAYL